MSARTIPVKLLHIVLAQYAAEYLARDDDGLASAGTFVRESELPTYEQRGWVVIGELRGVATMTDTAGLTERQVAVLQAEKQRVLADAQARATQIDGAIQSLLAITMEPRP